MMITHDVGEVVLLSYRIAMLSNGPEATVGEILSVERHRRGVCLVLAKSLQKTEYRSSVLRFLYEKQRNVEPPTDNTEDRKAKKPLHPTQTAQ